MGAELNARMRAHTNVQFLNNANLHGQGNAVNATPVQRVQRAR